MTVFEIFHANNKNKTNEPHKKTAERDSMTENEQKEENVRVSDGDGEFSVNMKRKNRCEFIVRYNTSTQ